MFNCSKCGLCCRSLNEYYSDLDRGDKVCRYLDTNTNLCKIYDNRPIKCRIDDFYDKYLSNIISRDIYYSLNYDVCKNLHNH